MLCSFALSSEKSLLVALDNGELAPALPTTQKTSGAVRSGLLRVMET